MYPPNCTHTTSQTRTGPPSFAWLVAGRGGEGSEGERAAAGRPDEVSGWCTCVRAFLCLRAHVPLRACWACVRCVGGISLLSRLVCTWQTNEELNQSLHVLDELIRGLHQMGLHQDLDNVQHIAKRMREGCPQEQAVAVCRVVARAWQDGPPGDRVGFSLARMAQQVHSAYFSAM
jgi:hypothetical protein